MKKIVILTTILFLTVMISGCFEPPPSGVIEPDIDNIDISANLLKIYNDDEDQIMEWIISGSIINNDSRAVEWILIRSYFYDETGKYLQYHEDYEYNGYLIPGESINFEINWYIGDPEGDVIADIEELPQKITYDYSVINVEYSIE